MFFFRFGQVAQSSAKLRPPCRRAEARPAIRRRHAGTGA